MRDSNTSALLSRRSWQCKYDLEHLQETHESRYQSGSIAVTVEVQNERINRLHSSTSLARHKCFNHICSGVSLPRAPRCQPGSGCVRYRMGAAQRSMSYRNFVTRQATILEGFWVMQGNQYLMCSSARTAAEEASKATPSRSSLACTHYDTLHRRYPSTNRSTTSGRSPR